MTKHLLPRKAWRAGKSTVLLIALSVALIASPAGATSGNHGLGSGSGEEVSITYGTDYGNPPTSFCLEVTASEYVVDLDGEFYATENSDTAGYAGPATLHWETTETYYIAPEGIYTGLTVNNECDPATLGDPVDADVWVTDPGGASGQITCATVTGGYSRVSNAVTVEWTGSCEVVGNVLDPGTSSTPSTTEHIFTGTMTTGDPTTVSGAWEYPAP